MSDCPNADVGNGRPNLVKKKSSTLLESASDHSRAASLTGGVWSDDGRTMRATRVESSSFVTPPRLYQTPSRVSLTSSTCKRPPLTSSIDIKGSSFLFSRGLLTGTRFEPEDSCFLPVSWRSWANARLAAWTPTNNRRRVEANTFTKAILVVAEAHNKLNSTLPQLNPT